MTSNDSPNDVQYWAPVVMERQDLERLKDDRRAWRTAALILFVLAIALLVRILYGAPDGCAPFQ